MTASTLIVIGLLAIWPILIILALLWLSQASAAGQRFDQVMADHYRSCPDEIEVDQ